MKKKTPIKERDVLVDVWWFGLSCSLQTSFDLHEPTPCRPSGAGGPLWLCSYLVPPNQICVYFTFPLCLCHQTRLHSPTVTIVVTLPTPSSRTPHCNVVDYLVLWICVCAVCKRFDQIIWIGLFLVSLFANGPDLPWWCLRENTKAVNHREIARLIS